MGSQKRISFIAAAVIVCVLFAGCFGGTKPTADFSGTWEGSVSFPGKGDYSGVEFTVPASLQLSLDRKGRGEGAVSVEERGAYTGAGAVENSKLTLSSAGDYDFTGEFSKDSGDWILKGRFIVYNSESTDSWSAVFYPAGTGHKLGTVQLSGDLPQSDPVDGLNINGYWEGDSKVLSVTAIDPDDQSELDSWENTVEWCSMEVEIDQNGEGTIYLEQEDGSYYDMEAWFDAGSGWLNAQEDLADSYSYLDLTVEATNGGLSATGYLTLQTDYAEFYMEIILYQQ